MRQAYLILLSAWLFVGCSPRMGTTSTGLYTQNQVIASNADKPEWVVSKPVKAGYFVGLGSAKTYQENYHRIAKNKALEDMVTEISVTIDASSFLHQAEYGSRVVENYEAFIKTSSLEELSEFDLLDDWTNGAEYWVVYTLSKSRYQEIKKQKRQAALSLALEHLKNAGNNENQGNFLTAIYDYLRTIDALKEHFNEPLIAPIAGNEQQPIIPFCTNAIQGILDDLRIGEAGIEFHSMKKMPAEITLYCRDKIAGGFQLHSNNMKFTANQQGKFFVGREAATEGSLLKLKLSGEFLQPFGDNNIILSEIITAFNFPAFDIPVSVSPVTLYIQQARVNIENVKPEASIKPAFVNFLSTYGFVFSEKPKNSDYRLTYKITTRQGPENNGLFVCWVDLEIHFFNAANDLLYSNQLVDVKGIHSSYPSAEAKAVKNITLMLEEKIIQPLVKYVF